MLGGDRNRRALFSQTQPSDKRAIAVDVLAVEVSEQPSASPYQLEETPTGRFVVIVGSQMVGECHDPVRQLRDLHLG